MIYGPNDMWCPHCKVEPRQYCRGGIASWHPEREEEFHHYFNQMKARIQHDLRMVGYVIEEVPW